MTNKASRFLKHMITAFTSMAKTKTNAIRNRIIIFSLLRNKRFFLSSLSHKLQNLASNHHHHKIKSNDDDEDDEDDDQFENDNDGAMVRHDHRFLSNPTSTEVVQKEANYFGGDGGSGDNDKYPDLTHSLFNDEDLDKGGSVIDLVRNSKPEGEEFRLEDEIDRVADLFIRKFHRQIRMQKQLSFKMYEDMLQRTV